jgi:DNA integrity scanning protein DisA with diadenylate cyclase activity
MIELNQSKGVIDFILQRDEIVKVRGNTYLHCSFEDLMSVDGIGERKANSIKEYYFER